VSEEQAQPPEPHTSVDRTIAVDTQVGQPQSVLLVYGDVGTGERSRLVDIPDGSDITFGRSRRCTVHIDSESVSRSHARLSRSGNSYTIEDLGSRNGTCVNGEKITSSTILRSGDEISVGPITAVLSISSTGGQRPRLGTTSYLDERLAAECDRGHRYQRTCGLVMLRLEGSNDSVDSAVEQIASRLRTMDVVAEYSPDELAIILPETDQRSASSIAERLVREALSVQPEPPSAIRVGLAMFPEHATSPDALISRARDALQVASTKPEKTSLEVAATEVSMPDVVMEDPQTKRVFQLVERVAGSDITVLIHGETGSGKEVVAAALHRSSKRSDGPYVRLNCASIPETLLESELFGHEKGAFTGADKRKHGYFEAANGGTIFLDEIGEISASLQAKLLRVLENRTITRVGGTTEIPVDVRVICATNRDLDKEVQAGKFREDLFYRVSPFSIVVPALRDRPGDILPLAEAFMRQSSKALGIDLPVLSPAARDRITSYHWPGNVRQLRNAMERAVILASDGMVELDHLPDRVRLAEGVGRAPVVVGDGTDMREQIADMEKQSIERALAACGGNQTKAARKLGLSRRALIYKMEKHGLKKPPASRR
jgi:DNA-binding NtrC family response regulator/pSer/pThr/pTyr-binding forkhead associated (FHA) protein